MLILPAVLFYATSCAPARAASPATGGVDAPPPSRTVAVDTARIRRLIEATAPDSALQIMFDWSMQDREAKFQGKGIVRMQGPYHARLDLFGPADIQVLRVRLVQDSLELVYAGPRVPVPPVSFLWSVLGVVRSPTGLTPATVSSDGDGVSFSYEAGSSHWRFKADSATLKSAEWLGDDGGRRTVELSGPFRFGRPSKATFRDWREFRELVITVSSVEKVQPFDPEIWNVSSR